MNLITCPVCTGPIHLKITETRRTGKPCISMRCDSDPRHFRAFITDRGFIERMQSEAGLTSVQAVCNQP